MWQNAIGDRFLDVTICDDIWKYYVTKCHCHKNLSFFEESLLLPLIVALLSLPDDRDEI